MRVAVLVLVTIRLAVAELQAEQVEVEASGKFGILRPPLLGAGGLNPVQTCIGAFCQQNNQNHGGQGGGGFGGGGNTFHPRPPFSGGAGSGGGLQPSQTCLGGQCSVSRTTTTWALALDTEEGPSTPPRHVSGEPVSRTTSTEASLRSSHLGGRTDIS